MSHRANNLVAGALTPLPGCASPSPVEHMQPKSDQPPTESIKTGFSAECPGVSHELPDDITDDLGDREKSGLNLANTDTAQPLKTMKAT